VGGKILLEFLQQSILIFFILSFILNILTLEYILIMWMWLLGCCLVLLLFYYTLKDLVLVHVYGMPPGPLSLPLIGGAHHLSLKHTHLSLTELGKKYGGMFSIRLGPVGRVVMIQDMKLITQVFEHPDCNDRPPMKVFEIISNGFDGIGTCAYSRRWKDITQIFHKGLAKLSQASLESRANHSYHQLFDQISATKLGTEYHPGDDIHNTCSAVFASLVYGIEPQNLSSQDLAMHKQDHQTLFTHLNPMCPVNLCPPLIHLPFPGLKQLKEIVNKRDKAMNASFMSHQEGFTGQINDMMDIIISYVQDRDSGKMQHDIRLPDLFLSSWTMYLAGCQTIVDTLMWSILYLSCFPQVQAAMHEEIDKATQKTTKVLEQKCNLHYTRAAIFEIIRLASPVANGIPKYNTRDIQLGEYTLPKGTMMFANQWPLHHDETHWPDPFQLKPERFLDEDGNLYTYQHIFHRMPYLPFSFGKRPCLGKHLGLDLLLIFIVGLLRKYDLALPTGCVPDLTGEMSFNLAPPRYPVVITAR